MTQLIDVLQLSQFNGLTAAECLASGNILVSLPLDHTPYTWSGIGEKLILHGVSPTQLLQFYSGIATLPGGPILDKCLSSGGFDFADAFNIATIMSFEIYEPDWAVEVLNGMLAIGSPTGTTWQLYGVAQPTLEDCTNALATIVSQKAAVLAQAQISAFMYEQLNPLLTQNLSASSFKSSVLALLEEWNPS